MIEIKKIINGDTLYETEKIEETENKENNLPVFNEEEVIETTITYEEQLPIQPDYFCRKFTITKLNMAIDNLEL